MFSINGTTISLTRGDTLCLNVELTKDGEGYTPATSDRIRFTMKKSTADNIPLIQKVVYPDSYNKIMVEITPADTKPLAFGTYKYDMEITDENGRVYTFVIGDFKVTEEVS